MSDKQDFSGKDQPSPRKKMRRRLWWSGGILAFIVVLGLVIFIGPRHAARYVVAQELTRMGVVHEGVDTINIDLWEQEASFGPIRFRVGGDNAGQVNRFRLKLQLWNLLSRRAVINSVIVEGVDIRLHRTTNGVLSINGISLEEFAGGGTAPADPANAKDDANDDVPWHAGLEALQLRDSRLLFSQEGGGTAQIRIDRLDLQGFRTWEPDKPGQFDLTGRFNDMGLRVKGEARPFADRITMALNANISDAQIAKIERLAGSLGFDKRAGTLGGDFKIDGALFSDGRIDAAVKGQMTIADVNLSQAHSESSSSASILSATAVAVDMDLKYQVQADGDQAISGVTNLKATAPRFGTGDDVSIALDSMAVSLNKLAASVGRDSNIAIRTRPVLSFSGFKLDGPQPLSLASLDVALSDLTLSGPPGGMTIKGAGSVDTKDVKTRIAASQPVDANIGQLGLTIEEFAITLGDKKPSWRAKLALTADDTRIKIEDGNAASIELHKMGVGNIAVTHELGIVVGEILLTGLQATLTEKILGGTATTGVAGPEAQSPAESTSPAPPPASEPAGSPATIQIARLALADQARIGFTDKSVSPPIDLKIAIDTLEIGAIDSAAPSSRSNVTLKATINQFTGIDLTGWAAPFGGKPDFDLKSRLTGLELPRFSAYAARTVGMNLDSGQLNVTANAKAKQAVLDASLKVNVKDLKFVVLSPEDEKKLSGAVGMPVQTAVGLLQDSDNVINITVPVGGSVTAPEFDLSDAIGQAVGGALKSLFPPTALASMLLSSGGGSGIAFKPIPFASGKATLGPEGTRFADRLVTLLTQRPKLGVRVCGKASATDLAHFAAREFEKRKAAQARDALRQAKPPPSPSAAAKPVPAPPPIVPLAGQALYQAALPDLSKLALERTKTIRSYLLNKSGNITGRVSECRSAFDPKDKELPRVDVSL